MTHEQFIDFGETIHKIQVGDDSGRPPWLETEMIRGEDKLEIIMRIRGDESAQGIIIAEAIEELKEWAEDEFATFAKNREKTNGEKTNQTWLFLAFIFGLLVGLFGNKL